MQTTKVIECPICLDSEGTDTCTKCNGSGTIEVDMTPEEIEMEDACARIENGISKWL